MKIGMHRLRFFILLFAASSLLFQFPSEAFAATPSDITVTDTEIDGVNGFDKLGLAVDVATFTIGSGTYAIVTSWDTVGQLGAVTIIDISDPTNIVVTDTATDGVNGFDELLIPTGVDTFMIGSSTYAIVVSSTDDGVQIIDISDPTDIVAKDSETDGANGFDELDGADSVDTFTIGSSTYAIVVSSTDNGVQMIDISDPADIVAKDSETDGENGFTNLEAASGVDTFTVGSSTYAIVTGNGVQIIDISDPTNIVATDAETDGENGFTVLGNSSSVETFTIGSSTYAIVTAKDDNGVTIIELNTGTTSTGTTSTGKSSICTRLVILGNCGTIAINNDEYRIIHPWSTIPTTEVMVGEPVSITLSTPHNYAAGKINSVSIYTEIFGSPTNYELGSHIDYSITKSDYYVSESELFQVAGATHRIVQDPDVKNLKMFEVVFTMVFAKPMDTSYIVVETKNIHGIPETIYLGNALKVIERPIELLTYEEKSKFELISEPELKASPSLDMDPEPDMDMLAIDPEPVVSKVTCGNGTMLKDNLCVPNEMSFYFFVNQFMRLFG